MNASQLSAAALLVAVGTCAAACAPSLPHVMTPQPAASALPPTLVQPATTPRPSFNAPPTPQPVLWPSRVLLAESPLGVIATGPHTVAALVSSTAPVPPAPDAALVLVDTLTGRTLHSAAVPYASTLSLGGRWLWVGSQTSPGAAETLRAFDFASLRLALTAPVPPPAPSAHGSACRMQIVGTDADVWVTDGGALADLNASTGVTKRVVALPDEDADCSIALQAGGRRVYVSTNYGDGSARIREWDALASRFVATTPTLFVVAPGVMAATGRGLWAAEPTGMSGYVTLMGNARLETVRDALRCPGDFCTNGVFLSLGANALWVGDTQHLWCADPATGKVRAASDNDLLPSVVVGGEVVGAGIEPQGLVEAIPPRACFTP